MPTRTFACGRHAHTRIQIPLAHLVLNRFDWFQLRCVAMYVNTSFGYLWDVLCCFERLVGDDVSSPSDFFNQVRDFCWSALRCKIPDKIPTKNQRNRKNRKINERNKQEIEQNSPKELISTSWLRMIYFIYNHVWALDTEITFIAFRIIWIYCNRVSTTAYIETWNRVWAWCPHGFEKSRKLSHFFAVCATPTFFGIRIF
jgi:hypothetical protein